MTPRDAARLRLFAVVKRKAFWMILLARSLFFRTANLRNDVWMIRALLFQRKFTDKRIARRLLAFSFATTILTNDWIFTRPRTIDFEEQVECPRHIL